MAMRIGYLLPTREAVMEGRPEAAPLIDLAVHAESQGYDSVWVGDSLLARPRHEPLTMLAAAATRTRRIELGTAVFLPMLRNPVVLAHQLATLDQISEGRLVLGAGIATDVPPVRAEFMAAGVPFEGRVGRMMEGLRLCRALWTGQPVDWDGRWTVKGGTLGPVPYRPGGPPIWLAGSVRAAFERAARHFDGWFANGPDAPLWGAQWAEVKAAARAAGRDPATLEGVIYLTLAVDEDQARANERLDAYLERYYGQPAAVTRRRQSCYAGPAEGAAQWIHGYAEAGATHAVLRFAGDHIRQIDAFARLRAQLG
jgi:alkanesulfonate monooxygenase SsuD/methylene tetrahydromethanopterin reductase-like flavin-dependent oxidoreductase (luciferase family)